MIFIKILRHLNLLGESLNIGAGLSSLKDFCVLLHDLSFRLNFSFMASTMGGVHLIVLISLYIGLATPFQCFSISHVNNRDLCLRIIYDLQLSYLFVKSLCSTRLIEAVFFVVLCGKFLVSFNLFFILLFIEITIIK